MAAMATQCVAAASLASSFSGQRNVFSMKKNVVVQSTQRCRLTVRASQGSYIPSEHKFLYEGVEKMGPVSSRVAFGLNFAGGIFVQLSKVWDSAFRLRWIHWMVGNASHRIFPRHWFANLWRSWKSPFFYFALIESQYDKNRNGAYIFAEAGDFPVFLVFSVSFYSPQLFQRWRV